MRTFEELMETLTDEKVSSFSRRSAISDLGRLGDERAVKPLVSELQNEDQYVRREAAKALGELGSSAAVESLIEALGDSEEYVRRNAIVALGLVGDARAIEPLEHRLEDQSLLTRMDAKESLRKIEERLKESVPAEAEAALPAQEETVEEEPEISSTASEARITISEISEQKELPPKEVSADTPIQEVILPDDTSAEHVEETGGPAESLTEQEQEEDALFADRKLANVKSGYIQVRTTSEGARGDTYLRVRLDKSDFYPGDLVRGKVLLHAVETLKSRGVYLSVEGKEEAKWTERSGNSSTTYRSEHTIIDETIPLSGDQLEVQSGDYEYPFEFRLPGNSTPSYRSGVCLCEYSVSAHIDVPMRRDVKGERSFQVASPVIYAGRQTKPISLSSKHDYQNITLSVTLQNDAFTIGSIAEGAISFQNYSRKKIRGINAELLCQEHAYGYAWLSSRRKTKITELVKNSVGIPMPEGNVKGFQTDFSLRVPNSAPKTNAWHVFGVKAFVKVNLNVAWGSDVSCSHLIHILPAVS